MEHEIELGNLFFGHSRGEYCFPDRELVDCPEWRNLLEVTNSDFYGYASEWDNPLSNVNDRGGYENDVFAINPYWWGDDENREECLKPNFLFKPTGFEITWYKYPFRDSYMNKDYSEEQIKQVWSVCIESVKEKTINISTDLKWEKICKYIINTYNINEEEVCQYIIDHSNDFIEVKLSK